MRRDARSPVRRPTDSVVVAPVHADPGHCAADEGSSVAPGEVSTVDATPASSTKVEQTSVATVSHCGTRRKAGHEGYYRALHKGQL
jgi:hypothetical protein